MIKFLKKILGCGLVEKNETKRLKPWEEGPQHTIDDFYVGQIVSVKPGVCPGGRSHRPVQEVGLMMLHGKVQPAVRVMGLPYYPDELTISSEDEIKAANKASLKAKLDKMEREHNKIKQTIKGLWA